MMERPWRVPLLVLGCILVAVSPAVGLLPGPGGIFLFAGGLILLMRNSTWAKRRYAEAKRRWPKLGHLAERMLRRPSWKRRRARHAESAND